MAQAQENTMLNLSRVGRWWRMYQWPAVWTLGGVALVLGCVGHWLHFTAQGLKPSFFDVLHPTLQLFVLNAGAVVHPNWALEIARFLAPIVLGYTATRAFLGLFRQWFQQARLWRFHDHVVVCGLGRKGLQVVRDFRARRRPVVVIESDEHNDHVRLCRELGATVLLGDARHVDLLEQARVPKAAHVIATTGDDGVNVEIAVHAYQLFQKRPTDLHHKLHCLVHLVDPALCAVFKGHRMFRSSTDLFDVQVFNIYENCARLLFEQHPLDREHIGATSPVTAHLVVIGFGQMGQSVAVQAARIGHFANGKKLRLTVVDKKAAELQAGFLALYPQFTQVCDVAFIEADAHSVDVYEKIAQWADDPNCLLTVAVCLDDDSRSLTQALGLAQKLHAHRVPIRVRMEEDVGLASLLVCDEACSELVRQVTAFGQITRACMLDRLLSDEQDRIARRLHENYLPVARQDPNKQPGDEALKDWNQLSESYKESNRHVVDHIGVKMRAVRCDTRKEDWGRATLRDFTPDEVEVLSRMEHARWMAERQLAGWQYGPPPKDERRKTNPNIIPWDRLDEVNKEKDRQTIRKLRDLLNPQGEQSNV